MRRSTSKQELSSRGREREGIPVLKKPAKQLSHPRPGLPRVSDEIQRLATLLEAEVLTWPSVTSRPMFGLKGIYRRRRIFAVLPRTRAMDAPDSIGIRFSKRSQRIATRMRNDQRIVAPAPDAKWISFIIESEADIHDALNWLELAYREAGKS